MNEKPIIPDSSFAEENETDVMLASSGKTDYKIVLPSNGDSITAFAAEELSHFFTQATGAKIGTVRDNNAVWTMDAKYLSIGYNKLAEDAGVKADDDVGTSGFNIVTKGNTVFMLGKTALAALYAVYDFLHYTFGYEAYTEDCYDLNRADVVKLKALTVKSIPTFDIRFGPTTPMWRNNLWLRRLRFVTPEEVMMTPPSGDFWATTLDLVPIEDYYDEHPEYFSDQISSTTGKPNDLNFSNKGMWEVALESIKELIVKNPDKDRIMFGMQDVNTWDSSPESKAIIDKYGANSATIVLCANWLSEHIRDWLATEYPGRTVKLGIFSYRASLNAPVKRDESGAYVPTYPEMKLDKDVFVLLAPIGTDYRYSYDDPQNPVANAESAEAIKAWSAISEELFIWGYSQDFVRYMYPVNTYNTMTDLYRFYKLNNAVALYDQGVSGGTNGNTAFFELKQYVQSKLAWNVNSDMNTHIQNFIRAYYGEAAEPMQKYFDRMIALTTYDFYELDMGGRVYENLSNPKFFPKGEIDIWDDLVNEGYALIKPLEQTDNARYTVLKDRLDNEYISVLYLMIELHSQYFTADEIYNMKLTVKEYCEKGNITHHKEFADNDGKGASMNELYAYWGIN